MIPLPHRRQFLRLALGTGGALGLGAWAPRHRENRSPRQVLSRTERALGARVTLTVAHEEPESARRAIDAALAELDLIEDVMSLYRPHSQLCRLNHEGVLDNPHPHLVTVLHQAADTSARTGGAFDVTVQPLWELYAKAHRAGGLPGAADIAHARQRVDWRRVETTAGRVRLHGTGTAVTLNGIAQGFAADRVTSILQDHGIEHALVDAGEIRPLGSNADETAWTVGIQHPRVADAYAWLAQLDGRAVATSGDYATRFSADCRHHHILDPHTGDSPTEFSSVSVAARSGIEADALTKAVFVLGLPGAIDLIAGLPGTDALLILKDGRTLSTAHFPGAARNAAMAL
jgi:thiamine biosynthesis lipoprotein